MNKAKLHSFLNEQPTCVVARVNSSGGPSAATVGFSHDENFTFLIATNRTTRKYKDLSKNPKVALVIGFQMPLTVQVEGMAQTMTVAELGSRLEQHFQKVPTARRFASDEGQSYIVITPTWLRYVDMKDTTENFEIEEF